MDINLLYNDLLQLLNKCTVSLESNGARAAVTRRTTDLGLRPPAVAYIIKLGIILR